MTVKAPKSYHDLQMAIGQRAARRYGGGRIPTAVQLNGSDYIKFFEFWRHDHKAALKTIAQMVANAQQAQSPLCYLDVKYDYIKSALRALDDNGYLDTLVQAALNSELSEEEQRTLLDLLMQIGK